ncbi:MAG TPA: hypothetical protein VL527_03170 [Dongiaceae bacterium]|jgi:hypothetical protein|nr:hypothetical protein [Dongiaceae bacterium]
MSEIVVKKSHARLWFWICVSEFILLVILLMKYTDVSLVLNAPDASAGPQPGERYYLGQPGPWGTPEYTRINIEPPDDFIPPSDNVFPTTTWFFEGYDTRKLADFLGSCDLTPAQRTVVLNPANWLQDTNGLVVVPGVRTVLDLSPAARTKIYAVLAQNERNDFQCWPYTYRNGGFDDWFRNSGVSAPTTELVHRLVYPRGNALCFSDLPEVFTVVTNLPERHRLMKTLSRNASFLMKLQISTNTDVAKLVNYWAQDGRAKDIQPLLESLAEVPGGASLDIMHLLPPFARKRLNAYPVPPTDPNQPSPDCYWTALNFFNEPPDDRYYDDAIWRKELDTNYTIVDKPTYGDLVFLVHPDGVPVHCAVYLADNVVFTKNGYSFRQPWILMKLDDMLARYPATEPIKPVYFHAKARQ